MALRATYDMNSDLASLSSPLIPFGPWLINVLS